MKKHYLLRALLLVSLSVVGWFNQALSKGDSEKGKAKSVTCVACHGSDGNSLVPAFPKIAGQSPKYFIDQMKAYQAGSEGPRPNPVMLQIVAGLTEEDFVDLAAYYQTMPIRSGQTDPSYAELGQRIYLGGNLEKKLPACSACHGPKGMGNLLAGFPVLKGQHPEYTVAQLKAYRDGSRKTGTPQIMQAIAANMTDEEMMAVAHYIAGLP